MKSAPLPPDTAARFEFLEAMVAARRLVSDGHHTAAEVAVACGVTPEQIMAIPADCCLPENFIADVLDVSQQRINALSEDALAKLKRFHPELKSLLLR